MCRAEAWTRRGFELAIWEEGMYWMVGVVVGVLIRDVCTSTDSL